MSAATAPIPTLNKNKTIREKSAKQPQISNYITQDEDNPTENQTHYITQYDENTPAKNAWARSCNTRKLTQEVMLACMDTQKKQAIPRKLASRKFPLEILCEWAGSVMDEETGELF